MSYYGSQYPITVLQRGGSGYLRGEVRYVDHSVADKPAAPTRSKARVRSLGDETLEALDTKDALDPDLHEDLAAAEAPEPIEEKRPRTAAKKKLPVRRARRSPTKH